MSKDHIRTIFDWHIKLAKYRHYQHTPTNFVPLICGPSGSGKTYTIEQEVKRVEKELGDLLPFIKVDSTAYTAYGWEGANLEHVITQQLLDFKDAYGIAESLPAIVEHPTGMVVYIDEIDKIILAADNSSGARASQLNQQFGLLKLLDRGGRLTLESKTKRYGSASCENILFIFSGAFEPIFKSKFLHDNKSIGFAHQPKSHSLKELYAQKLTWKDFEQYGAVPELLNRITNLIQLNPPTAEEIQDIYNTSYDVCMVKNLLGYTPEIDACVSLVQNDKLGARAIAREAYQGAMEKAAKNCRTGKELPEESCRTSSPKHTNQ